MSVWNDILAAVKTLVDTATTVTVVQRLVPEVVPSDTLPIWIVTPAGEERVDDHAFTKLNRYVYPVAVLYAKANNRSFSTDTALLTERETIREALDVRGLSGVSSVIDVDLTFIPPSTVQDSSGTVVDVTGFLAEYVSWETRTNT